MRYFLLVLALLVSNLSHLVGILQNNMLGGRLVLAKILRMGSGWFVVMMMTNVAMVYVYVQKHVVQTLLYKQLGKGCCNNNGYGCHCYHWQIVHKCCEELANGQVFC